MLSTRLIKRQIQSTKNIGKITKAMQMVAAVKMRRSQNAALIARPYAEATLQLLDNVSRSMSVAKEYPLAEKRPVARICLLVVTSDKGFCGGLNSNVLKAAQRLIEENKDKEVGIVAIGKKAERFFRQRGTVEAYFDNSGDVMELRKTLPLSRLLMEDFTSKKYDKVIAIYANFVSTLKQDVKIKNLLPVSELSLRETIDEIGADEAGRSQRIKDATEYLFEPSPAAVLKQLLPNLVETQVFHVMLESNASEHSARMIAMKNATDNAKDLLEGLKLSFNYARQQKITQEMTEIAAGVAALE